MVNKLKILLITNLFPNCKEPNRGVFVKQKVSSIRKDCEIRVIAPLPWFPARINFLKRWSVYSLVPEQETMEGIPVYHPRWFVVPKLFRSLHGLFFFLAVIGTVRKMCKDFNFDVIYAQWMYPDGFASVWLAKILKKPIVLQAMGCDVNQYSKFYCRRKMIVYAINNSNRVIAVSKALKRKMVEIGGDKDRITVIQNGVNSDVFCALDKEKCRRELRIPNDAKVVLFVGNLTPVKGINYLLEAASKIEDPTFMLFIIGVGELEKELKDMSVRLGLGKRAVFVGAQPHVEISRWMNACDVLCLPSIREGMPNVVLEANSCGVPVVATDVGGIPDIIEPEKNGVLVRPHDSTALKDGIINALGRNWDRNIIRSSGAQRGWKEVAAEVFRELSLVARASLDGNAECSSKGIMGQK